MTFNLFTLNPFKKKTPDMLTSSPMPSPASATSYSPYSSATAPAGFKMPKNPVPNTSGPAGSSYDPFRTPTPSPSVNFGTPTNPQIASGTSKFGLSTNTSKPASNTSGAPVLPVTSPQFEPQSLAVSSYGSSSGYSGGSSGSSGSTGSLPSMPMIDASTQAAYDAAAKAYEDSLKLSPEELSTQQDLDNLISSTKKAYTDIEDKPIAMSFITGQLASVERRANTLAEPLERKLARMQAARQSSIEASKFGLERAEAKINRAREDYQFGMNYGLKQDEMAYNREKLASDRAEADRAFEENKRQFGLNYAQKEREIAYEKAQKADEEAKVESEKNLTAMNTVNNINQLLQGDYEGITGGIFGRSMLTRFGTTNQKEDALFKNIQASLALGARQLIKGSGAISDFEAQTLQNAASLFGPGNSTLSNEDFKDAMTQVKGALMSNSGQAVNVDLFDQNGNYQGSISTNREGIGKAIGSGLTVKFK